MHTKKKYPYAVDDGTPIEMCPASGGLKCPFCGDGNLHQLECRATWRQEDQDGICHTSSFTKEAKEKVKHENIPGRRNFLEIDFDCEFCEEIATMYIQQHKGLTHMGWFQ